MTVICTTLYGSEAISLIDKYMELFMLRCDDENDGLVPSTSKHQSFIEAKSVVIFNGT